ncbi:hypothetical protein CAOG_03009 [Capsaspora owczarzaki ATCC 30864]|uniref:Importin N-terminal domain-containing protein n=1 Tax=Capsaspora owczarzaki (strain ATCC 30864) TaxID=595528 RepID=A0A0D2WMD1_CAPO3|nr:hypothetical protein CAOG_03009 [Capsaspora owczarzaki ATCC 30864]KJE91965.1 hypothetical protein CAOG_003009 [Capsaspora owczarzaki ATCC 30864]|eukprot:XP_004363848.1 hypothetical protein CAOG_03009 [Capsaspora owczarzaki ATCC 30864]
MATIEDINPHVSQCLLAILLNDADSEQQLHTLEEYPAFSASLAAFLADNDVPPAVRQLAGILLQQFVTKRWQGHFARDPVTDERLSLLAPAPPADVKARVRELVVPVLGCTDSKLRSAAAYLLASIGKYEWESEWPEFFPIVNGLLQAGDKNQAHGALRVLEEFLHRSDAISSETMIPVLQSLTPLLHNIFISEHAYGVRARGRAVKIFTTCIKHIYTRRADEKKAIADAIVAPWIGPFVAVLSAEHSETADYGLRAMVLASCERIAGSFPPKIAGELLEPIVGPMWVSFVSGIAFYERLVVNATDATEAANYDSDGTVLDFDTFIEYAMQFLSKTLDIKRLRNIIAANLTGVAYYVSRYAQITEEQAERWEDDIDEYLDDEDTERSASASVRVVCEEVTSVLFETLGSPVAMAFVDSTSQLVTEALAARDAGSEAWWKLIEAPLRLLLVSQEHVLESHRHLTGGVQFEDLVRNLLANALATENLPPFFLGTALNFAAAYVSILSPEVSAAFLPSVLAVLTQDGSSNVLRVGAITALSSLAAVKGSQEALQPHVAALIESLVRSAMDATPTLLQVIIDGIILLLPIDQQASAALEARLTPLVLACCLRLYTNGMVLSAALDLLRTICLNPLMHATATTRIAPAAISYFETFLTSETPDEAMVELVTVFVDMIGILAASVPPEQADGYDSFFVPQFGALMRLLLHTNESGIVQEGTVALRGFVRSFPARILAFADANGNSGATLLQAFVMKVFGPTAPWPYVYFGDNLVLGILRKIPEVLTPYLSDMVQTMLTRMAGPSTDASLARKAFLVVIAFLMQTQLAAVLDLIANTTVGDKNGLTLLLQTWVDVQHAIIGDTFANKLLIISLCALLMSEDPRVMAVTLPVEVQVAAPSKKVRTRSQTRQTVQIQQLPAIISMFQVLAAELQVQQERAAAPLASAADEEESDYEDDDGQGDDDGAYEDVDDGQGEQDDFDDDLFGDLSDNMFADDEDDDKVEEEFDVADDPICTIDLKLYLTDFFRAINAKHPTEVEQMMVHVDRMSRDALKRIGI